jgi:hypothetical protein
MQTLHKAERVWDMLQDVVHKELVTRIIGEGERVGGSEVPHHIITVIKNIHCNSAWYS